MEWIFIGLIAGSIVVSGHPTREACEGRRVIAAEQKVVGKCVEAPRQLYYSTGTTLLTVPQ